MNLHIGFAVGLAVVTALAGPAKAAEIRVLTAGAFKQVVLALVPAFEKETGHKVTIDNGTAGELQKRIEGGEAFDVAVITPAVLDGLAEKGHVVGGSRVTLASVGIGVMVKAGAAMPDIGTVDAFKQALLAAKSVGYIDPKSGGSSGVYIEKLIDQLGIGAAVRAKARLKNGGYVADLIVSGEAELGLHQISEIVPVKGVTLVGPFPKEIQNTTTYAGALSPAASDKAAAQALMKMFAGKAAAELLKSKGMEPAS